MKSRPLPSRSRVRRVVSGKLQLPPSMRMSPGSSSGTSLFDELIHRRRRP